MKTGRKYGEKRENANSYKIIDFRTLQIYIFSFYAFSFLCITCRCKVLKDILQYHIVSHFSCNIGNEKDTFTYVL